MSALAIASSMAHAADTADLVITGTITPGSCTPVLDNTTFDYTNVMAKTGDKNLLSEKTAGLTITCSAATKVGFKIVDGQPNTAPWTTLDSNAGTGLPTFGLGFAADGTTKIGAYTLAMDHMQVNATLAGTAVDAQMMSSADGKTNWTASPTAIAALGTAATYAIAATTDTTVAPYMVYTGNLRLQAAIDSKEALGAALASDIPLNGSATINFDYL